MTTVGGLRGKTYIECPWVSMLGRLCIACRYGLRGQPTAVFDEGSKRGYTCPVL